VVRIDDLVALLEVAGKLDLVPETGLGRLF
jgi:hypothetical protein